MKLGLSNRWKKNKTSVIVVVIIAILVLVLILIGYQIDASGFNSSHIVTTSTTHNGMSLTTVTRTDAEVAAKSFWDWLQLLIVPLALAFGALWFSRATSRYEQEIALDKQREDLLQAYLDKMSELLLDKNLRKSKSDDEVRNVARVRTMTVLPRLDGNRKGTIVKFLHEAGLINKDLDNGIVSLNGADLRMANLSEASLREVILIEADLTGANLSNTDLYMATMCATNLQKADLYNIKLIKADLRDIKLNSANLIEANLIEANLLRATLTDANLFKSYLSDTNLTNANLNGAILDNANLHGSNITQEQIKSTKSSRDVFR